MTRSTATIPESVTGKDLADAMQPLLDLLGVSLAHLYSNGLNIDFVDGVSLHYSVPAGAGVTAAYRDRIPGNESSEFSVMTVVRVTSPMPDLGPISGASRVHRSEV